MEKNRKHNREGGGGLRNFISLGMLFSPREEVFNQITKSKARVGEQHSFPPDKYLSRVYLSVSVLRVIKSRDCESRGKRVIRKRREEIVWQPCGYASSCNLEMRINRRRAYILSWSDGNFDWPTRFDLEVSEGGQRWIIKTEPICLPSKVKREENEAAVREEKWRGVGEEADEKETRVRCLA